MNENITEVEKILFLSINQVILKFRLCNLENENNNTEYEDNYTQKTISKIINEINTKLYKWISKVNVSQEISFYKINNIQREVIDIISIYFNNN